LGFFSVIFIFAIIFNVTLLLSPVPLSNDIYIYIWDGKVINNGINPYAYTPNSYQLSHLRDLNWEKILNKNVYSIYPPLSHLIFAIAYFLSPSIFTLKLFSVLFNLTSIGVLTLIMKKLRLDTRYSVIYAWSPLVIIEFANSGHIDSLAVLFVLLSFLFLIHKRKVLSSIALVLGVLSKFYPLLFAPLFLLRLGKKGVLIFVGVITIVYLPFIITGETTFGGLLYFLRSGQFNGSLFPLILNGMGMVLDRNEALLISKIIIFVIFIGLLLYLTRQYLRSIKKEEKDILLWKYSFLLIGGFLLISPTVHPWYLIWIIPFLCFFRSLGWILLTGTIIFARSIYINYEATGSWEETWWAAYCVYVPFYIIIFYNSIKRIIKKKSTNSLYKNDAKQNILK